MHVCIIGAGPVGLLQCLYLKKYHNQLPKTSQNTLQISIYERRSQQELANKAGQRSINLALSWRGMKALEEVGLLQQVLENAVPMHGRFIHPLNGPYYTQSYSSLSEQVIYSVERLKIQKILLEAVLDHCINESNDVKIKMNFRQHLVRLDPESMILDFTSIKTVRADLVLGCDGAFSRVRAEIMKHYSGQLFQENFKHQYKEFKIPANANFGPKRFLHIWPRRNLMLIALPNKEGSFTATLFCDFDSISDKDPLQYFKDNFPDFLEAVGVDQFYRDWCDNEACKLTTVHINPIGIDRIVLLGDASHSILPFYGQGMNAGFEDVQLFTNELKQFRDLNDLPEVISRYSKKRIADSKAIDSLARENYKEMRDQVLNPIFIIRSEVLQIINKYFPTLIIPRYSMIAFTSIPYASIKKREIMQDVFILLVLVLIIFLIFDK